MTTAHLTFPDGVLSFTSLIFDVVTDEGWDLDNEISSHPVEFGSDITDNIRVGLAKVQLTVFATNEPFRANSFTTPFVSQTTVQIPGVKDEDSAELVPVTADRSGPATSVKATLWDNKLNFSAALKGTGSLVGGAVGGATGSVIGTAVGGIASALIAPPGPTDVTVTPYGLGQYTTPPQGGSVSVGLISQSNQDDFVSRMFDALETLRTTGTLITVIGSKNIRKNMVIKSFSMHRDAGTGTGAEFIIALQEIRFVTTQTVTAPAATVPRAKPVQKKGPQNNKPAPAPLNRSVMRDRAIQSVKAGTGMLNSDQIAAAGLTPADIAQIAGSVP